MLAVGFTLIFGVARILNLAHGSFYALGAYGAYVLTSHAHLPLLARGAAVRVLVVALFGVVDGAGSDASVAALAARGADDHARRLAAGRAGAVPHLRLRVPQRAVLHRCEVSRIAGVDISGQRLLALAVGVVVLGALWLFIQRTRLGAAILAISQDPEAAQYMGIPSDRIFSIVMGLSAGARGAGRHPGGALPDGAARDGAAADRQGLRHRRSSAASARSRAASSARCMLGYAETIVAFDVSIAWTRDRLGRSPSLLTLILRPAGFFGQRAAF